jgi:PEP-CTERM motif
MTMRNLLHLGLLGAIVLANALSPCTVEAGSTVYIVGSGNEFGTIDLTTGSFTSIGTLNLPTNDAIFGMGFGADGNLYGVDSQSDAHLWQINIKTAAVTDLGAIGQSNIGAGADASGKLYSLDQSASASFYTMNPPSLATNVVGSTGFQGDGLVAPNAAGTQVFASAITNTGASLDELYSINPTTGMATDIGNTGFFVYTGLFVNGTLYGFDGNSDIIITINTSTGTGTLVTSYSLPNGDAIDASALLVTTQGVPEPSSLVLGLFGTVLAGSVGLIRHRRRTSARVA